jgi:hypothetical protein
MVKPYSFRAAFLLMILLSACSNQVVRQAKANAFMSAVLKQETEHATCVDPKMRGLALDDLRLIAGRWDKFKLRFWPLLGRDSEGWMTRDGLPVPAATDAVFTRATYKLILQSPAPLPVQNIEPAWVPKGMSFTDPARPLVSVPSPCHKFSLPEFTGGFAVIALSDGEYCKLHIYRHVGDKWTFGGEDIFCMF